MTNGIEEKLEKLHLERDAKFDDVVRCLISELYPNGCPPSEAERKHLVEEAEELTDIWATAEANGTPHDLSTALQVLLTEHQEICRRIIDILDTE